MLLIYQKRSFTLVEIIVTTVILSLVMWGILGIFIAGKRHIMHARGRMTASEMGKLFLDPVQMAVNQTSWDNATNALYVGTGNVTTYCDSIANHTQNPFCPAERTVDSVNYTAQYDVDAVTGTNLRRVKVQAKWTELSP